MAAETKTSVAARFANFALVSAGDFGALIDSYTDHHDILISIATAAQGGAKGVVVVSGSSNVTLFSAQAQGLRVLNTATTAAAQQQLGGGTVGRIVFEAVTTASATGQLGAGTVGAQILGTTTTAAAQAIIGSVSAATQAEMEAAASNAVVATPLNLRHHPGVAKAYAFVEVTAAAGIQVLRSSHNVASVSAQATGIFRVTFSTAFSTQFYAPLVLPYGNGILTGRVSVASFPLPENMQSAQAVTIAFYNSGGSEANPVSFSIAAFGDL